MPHERTLMDACSRALVQVLDRNKIKCLEPHSLANLTHLRELRIEESGLRSLAHFGPLPLLHALFLGGNRIAELIEVDRIASLPNLIELVLANNPCARKPLYRPTMLRKLGSLRSLDGREIAPDERERADLLLTSDRPPVAPPPPLPEARLSAGNKVPLKLTSLHFDVFGGGSGGLDGGGLGLGGGLGGGAPSGAPHSANGLGGAPAQSQAAWHPLSGGHESFFLPAAKTLPGRGVQGNLGSGYNGGSGPPGTERRGGTSGRGPHEWRAIDP